MKKIIETVFIPSWNTIAIICEGGEIYIEFIRGIFFTKDEVRTKKLGLGYNEEFYRDREELFDEVDDYYRSRYIHPKS